MVIANSKDEPRLFNQMLFHLLKQANAFDSTQSVISLVALPNLLHMLFTSPGLYGNQTMHSTPLSNQTRLRPESDRLFHGLESLLKSKSNSSFCHSSVSDEGYASLQSILTPAELMQRIPSVYMRYNPTTHGSTTSSSSLNSQKPLTELGTDLHHDNLRPIDSIFNGQLNKPDTNPFARDGIDMTYRSNYLRPNQRPTPSGIENEKQSYGSDAQQIHQLWGPIIYQAFVSKLSDIFGNPRNIVNPFQEHNSGMVSNTRSAFQPGSVDLGQFSIDNLTQPNLGHKPILIQVRQEMIRLIDHTIQQLDAYFRQNPLPEPASNRFQLDADMVPLNLKSPPCLFTNLNKIYSVKDDKSSESSAVDSTGSEVSSAPTRTSSNLNQMLHSKLPESNSASKSSPKKHIQSLGLTRRFRRFGPSPRSKSRRLRIRQITNKYLQEQTKLTIDGRNPGSNMNESLDLRIQSQSNEVDRLTYELDTNESATECKRVHEDSTAKFTTLSAHHLKKAKLMFMYARYPHSNMLKSYFPDMVFNRSTTAQLVKWFSNFREFFYLQIEKFVRQAKAAGLSKPDQIDLVRNPELMQNMELHFNKGGEIPTPKEFINAIHTAVHEFAEAIFNNQDSNPTWRKAIYKKICLLDVIFPSFFKQI